MKLIGGRRFIKPYNFEYRPRYWDPEKEKLEKKLKAGKRRAEKDDPEAIKERISQSFRNRSSQRKEMQKLRSNQVKQSNLRLFLIIGILFMLAYILLTRFMPVVDGLF